MRALDDARREVRRHDPALGEGGEPAVEAADVVDHREERAGADAAGRAEEMRRDRGAADQPELFGLAHR